MRQITITLIVLLALTMGMASCSHESPVPFLEDMGVCTDSLLVDSFPSENSLFYRNSHLTWLNYEQSKKLGIDEFNPDSSWMLRESTKKRIKTKACDIISKCNVSTDCPYYYNNSGMCGDSNFEDSIVQTFYPKYLVPLVKSNLPAMLKWIVGHKSDTKVATCLRYVYSDAFRGSHKEFKPQDLKKQIMQLKDKEAQQYLLKVLIGE